LLRRLVTPVLMIVAFACSKAKTQPGVSTENPRSVGNPLLPRIEQELRKFKPDIVSTDLVSLVRAPAYRDTMTYAVIARGEGPHRGWQRMADVGEIFGVFWVDSTLTRPSAPIDVFASRRVRDYDVWLQRAGGNVVVVCAEGGAYGDGAMRREIEIEPDAGKPRKVTVDTSSEMGLANMGDASCGSSGPKGD
jgi:hypothetical protein